VTAQMDASWSLALLGQPKDADLVVIDSTTLTRLADSLGLDEREVSVRMRGLIDVHQPMAPFEMRSGAWRVELVPAVAKGIVVNLVGAVVLQLTGAVNVPFVVLGMAAGLLMSVEQVDVAEADVVVHARLSQAVSEDEDRSLADLYQELPADARHELSFDEFAAIALRLHEVGMTRWSAKGVRLREARNGRGLRLISRRPSDADIAAQLTASSAEGAHGSRKRGVFVIHGRDDAFTGKVYELLSLVGLRPMEWEPLVEAAGYGPAPFLHDVIRSGMHEAQAIVALLTPDDIVQLHPDLVSVREDSHETRTTCQPRPNVLMELGIALYAYRERTVVVKAGSIRPIADLGGINYVDFDGGETSRAKLVERLRIIGCPVEDGGAEWRRQSRFDGLGTFERRPG
jgi:predicted nucleotide-binding protein